MKINSCLQFVTTGRRCRLISFLEMRRLCPEYREIQALSVGRKNEKFLFFLICISHLPKVTSRKVGKL
jgi:hypothetical protein